MLLRHVIGRLVPTFRDRHAVQKRRTPFYIIHGYAVSNQTNWTYNHKYSLFRMQFFFMARQPLIRPGPPHCQGFTITLRHTTLSRTPLDD